MNFLVRLLILTGRFKNTHTGRENSQTVIMASIWDLINYSFHLT